MAPALNPPDAPQPTPERLPVLLASAVQRLEEGGEAALAAFFAEHADMAAELRRHLSILQGIGMLHPGDGSGARDAVPERLGEFRLVERLGSGGMGIVYLARQESLKRDVALKLIRPELLYFPQSRARFRREIEAVAQLQHPGIVRVYSADEAASPPYFAMERIDGVSLDRLLAQLRGKQPRRLGERDLSAALATLAGQPVSPALGARERGWTEICCQWARDLGEALDYAHRRGVLHRDVKPANVMVTWSGRVMLLDFGLAATRDGGQITRTGSRLGSLPYMAPEQLRGEHERVDERADVYALGVLLYELVALQNPFHDGTGSDEQARRRIVQHEFVPLRQRNPAVSWDVETVCLCAMAPEPARRYQHVADLARDLQNVLDQRPIAARRPPLTVRLRRLVGRHPAASVALATGFLLVVVMPTVVAAREHGLRASVVLENSIREETLRFLNEDLLAAVAPDRIGKDATLRQALDAAARQIGERFPDRPLVEAAIRDTLGDTYRRLGVLGEAETHLDRALSLYRQHTGESSRQTLALARRLAIVLGDQGHRHEAVALERDTLARCRAAFGNSDPDTLAAANNLGLYLTRIESYQEAELLLREVVEIRERVLGERHGDTQTSISNLASVYYNQGRLDAAEPLMVREFELSKQNGAEAPATLISMSNLANLFAKTGRTEQALALQDRLVASSRRVLGDSHPATINRLLNRSRTLAAEGRHAEAAQDLQDARTGVTQLPPGHRLARLVELFTADLQRRTGKLDEASTTIDALLRELAATDKGPGSLAGRARLQRATIDAERGEHAAAEAVLSAHIDQHTGEPTGELASLRVQRGSCRIALRRHGDAETDLLAAHGFLAAHAKLDRELGRALEELTRLYTSWGRPDQAVLWLQRREAWDSARAGR